eukprot:SAG11_NODE_1253_length_5385_cov_1.942679_3_plen_101_part_00
MRPLKARASSARAHERGKPAGALAPVRTGVVGEGAVYAPRDRLVREKHELLDEAVRVPLLVTPVLKRQPVLRQRARPTHRVVAAERRVGGGLETVLQLRR